MRSIRNIARTVFKKLARRIVTLLVIFSSVAAFVNVVSASDPVEQKMRKEQHESDGFYFYDNEIGNQGLYRPATLPHLKSRRLNATESPLSGARYGQDNSWHDYFLTAIFVKCFVDIINGF